MPPTPRQAAVLDYFARRPVATLARVRSALAVSHMTVFRALSSAGYYTSFNHNARYYTLGETPRFDAAGLWFYRSIGFSRHRTLPETLVALVRESPAGGTAAELSGRLRTAVANLLARLVQQSRLARRRLGRQTIYLAPEASQQESQ